MDKAKDTRGIKIKHWKIIAFYLLIYDVVAVNASYFLGLLLRFDLRYSNIPEEYLYAFFEICPNLYIIYGCRILCVQALQQFMAFCQLQ